MKKGQFLVNGLCVTVHCAFTAQNRNTDSYLREINGSGEHYSLFDFTLLDPLKP